MERCDCMTDLSSKISAVIENPKMRRRTWVVEFDQKETIPTSEEFNKVFIFSARNVQATSKIYLCLLMDNHPLMQRTSIGNQKFSSALLLSLTKMITVWMKLAIHYKNLPISEKYFKSW